MRYRCLAPEDLAHDCDVVLVAVVRPTPGFAVPALDNLWAGYAETGNETSTTCHGINCRCAHRSVGRRACSQLHDAGAKLDSPGQRCEVGKRGYGVGAVGLGCPYAVIPELLGALHKLDR